MDNNMHGMSPQTSSMSNHTNGSSSSSSSSSSSTMTDQMMTHMTFFWGKNSMVLFSDWPGTSSGMYALCLIVIFFLAVLTELATHSGFLKGGSTSRAAGLVQTAVYTLKIGLAYLVMLAVMSFNGGVFLVAVAGHAVGFFFFGSRVFRNSNDRKTAHILPPSGCAC